jgi:condensin complex subunit 1
VLCLRRYDSVHTEGLGRAVRRARVARDRLAAEASEAAAAKGVTHGEEAELAAALGQGAVAEVGLCTRSIQLTCT